MLNNFFSDENQIVKLDLPIELGEVCEKLAFCELIQSLSRDIACV